MTEQIPEPILNFDSLGLANVLMRVGAKNRDVNDTSAERTFYKLTDADVQEMFRNSGIIRKVITRYPQEAKNLGYVIKDLNGGVIEKNNPLVLEAFERAMIYSRLYGRCLLYCKFNDTVPENKPIKPGVKLIGYEIKFDVYQDGDFFNFNGVDRIHFTRVIEFIGAETFVKDSFANDINRHDSVLQSMFTAWNNFLSSDDDARYILKNISYLSIGIDNLGNMSKSTEGREMIYERLTTLNINRSINRTLAYDKTKECMDFITQTLAGVESILDRAKDIFIAESDYPPEKLFEQSTTQSLGTGIQNQLVARYLWAKRCHDWTKNHELKYYITYFSRVIENFSENFILDIPFIVESTEPERAETEKLGAERAKILIDAGIISPDEARTAYRESEYTLNIELDDNAPRKNVVDMPKEVTPILKEDNPDNPNNSKPPVTENQDAMIPDDAFWIQLATLTDVDLNDIGTETALTR